jgi:hypothetical protein
MHLNMRKCAVLIGVALACGSLVGIAAAAGNPHGTPGQAQPAPAAQPAATSQPPGQAKKQDQAAANAQPTTADNSTGIKPSSTTLHTTWAAAGSNKTKQYGNGKTAGQIAMQHGASADTQLYGPGNSQPHKVAPCVNGKTHYVDVHALKAHAAGACPTAAVTASAAGAASTTHESAATGPAQASAVQAIGTGGVLGGQATINRPARSNAARPAAAGGVLGAHYSQAKPAKAVLGTAHFTG